MPKPLHAFQTPPSGMKETLLYPGAILQNRYQIGSLLSLSEAGELYKVSDLRFPGKSWIVKILRIPWNAELEQSAKTLLAIPHPNLVKVVDFFEKYGLSYFVMELVEGNSLEQLLEKSAGPLPEQQILSWMIQAVHALLCLHAHLKNWKGYWNLSPRKMLITPLGGMKLLPPLTSISKNLTSRAFDYFLPPEVFEEFEILDERAEIYSLAAVLFRALSGKEKNPMPFDFSGILLKNPKLYSRIQRILEKAAQVEPKRRYRNLRLFQKELFSCFQIAFQPQTLVVKPEKSRRFLWTFLGIFLGVLLTLLFKSRFLAPLRTTLGGALK